MSLIVDASVAVKWFAAEEGTEAAQVLLEDSGDALLAPDLLLIEVANALWKKWKRGVIVRAQLRDAISELGYVFPPPNLVPVADLADEAADLAGDLGHPIYDCLYIALTRRTRGGVLVTDDRRLLAAAARCSVAARPLVS